MTKKRKSNNPLGRPSKGLVGPAHLVRLPVELDARVRAAATAEGLSLVEWWRRAARGCLEKQTAER